MNYLKISLGILLALSASRFVPHPPNFTSLLALSFYVPAIFGIRYLPSIIIAFAITDLFIGFHSLTLFTWGSVLIIGYLSKYLNKNVTLRLTGSILGPTIFFVLTNFGVWILGGYDYSFKGLITCYVLAIPFFFNSLFSTVLFSVILEILIKLK